MNSRFLKPGHRVHTVTHDGCVHRSLYIGQGEVREVRYAFPAGNKGKARTYIEFTDGLSGEFPTNAFWIMEG